MRKTVLLLLPLLASCTATPTPSSAAFSDDTSDDTSIETTDSISSSEQKPQAISATYSLSRVMLGINYPFFEIVFGEDGRCLFHWFLDGEEFTSHQKYSIQYDQNIIFSFVWDTVTFTDDLVEGDSPMPESLAGCEYKYFNSKHSTLSFESAGAAVSFDEYGSVYTLGKLSYDFSLVKNKR